LQRIPLPRGWPQPRSGGTLAAPQASTERGEMIGALIVGLVAGFIGRALVPNDIFSGMKGPQSWLVSILLGLVGAFVGYLIFTRGLGIGDDDAFDLGGVLSAIIGVIIVLILAGFIARRMAPKTGPDVTASGPGGR